MISVPDILQNHEFDTIRIVLSENFDEYGLTINEFHSLGFGCLWGGNRDESYDEDHIWFVFIPKSSFQNIETDIRITGFYIENYSDPNCQPSNGKYSIELEYRTSFQNTNVFYTDTIIGLDLYQTKFSPILNKIVNDRKVSIVSYKHGKEISRLKSNV